MNETWLIVIIILICYIYFVNLLVKSYKQYLVVNKYKNYQEILRLVAEESYETIYKDQILTYVIDGLSLVGNELETIKRNFIKLSLELMDKKIEDTLIDFYNSRETIIKNLLIFFQKKIEDDEFAEYIKKKKKTDSDEMSI